jgi:hypothetical protein
VLLEIPPEALAIYTVEPVEEHANAFQVNGFVIVF